MYQNDLNLHISLEACSSSIYPNYNPPAPPRDNHDHYTYSFYKKSNRPKSKSKSSRNRIISSILDYVCSCFRP